MAEQLNKLGKVLVYDSDVNLVDRTPGGKGFQSVTLDNAGAFVDGTLTGKDIHYVKADGTPDENGQALLDTYSEAKAAAALEGSYSFSVASVSDTFVFGIGTGDTSIPFNDTDNRGGFTMNVTSNDYDYILYDLFRGADTITISDGTNTSVVRIVVYGVGTSTQQRFYITEVVSGTPIAFDSSNITLSFNSTQWVHKFLIAAPGSYKLSENFVLDGPISISSADGLASIFIEGSGIHIEYANNAATTTNVKYISGFNTREANIPFYITSGASATTFKNIVGGENTFNTYQDNVTVYKFKFENCVGGARSFFAKVSGDDFYQTGNDIQYCEFNNCKVIGDEYGSDQGAFGVGAVNLYRCWFRNCKNYYISKSFGSYSDGTGYTKFIDCEVFGNQSTEAFCAYLEGSAGRVNIINCKVFQATRGFLYNCTNLTDALISNCYATGQQSFGTSSTGGGWTVFNNCVSEDNNAFNGTSGFEAYCIDCIAGTYDSSGTAFQGVNITMKLINCKNNGNFTSVSGTGFVSNCIGNWRNAPVLVNL